jgi:hypothetical protein|tara:strand:- start:6271 stop:6645 length:375 start_codon:yes stop_codon:yes gene_type:complete
MEKLLDLKLYVVTNNEGLFFRGHAYIGISFTDEVKQCKVYSNVGPAKSAVTYFSRYNPTHPPLKIVKINVAGYEIIDESDRVQKAEEAKLKAESIRKVSEAKLRLIRAETNLKLAEEQFNNIKK